MNPNEIQQMQAASQDAFTTWTCPSCAWTEFDLIEEEAEAEPQATTR